MAQEYERSNKKKFKMSDDDLLGLVKSDIEAAEAYFDDYLKPQIITRYELLHSNKDYYRSKFKELSKSTDFSTTDIKDAIEWQMPSVMEVFFGADKIVGILGRTPDDNPEPLERLIEFQIKTLNEGFKVFEQWLRDPFEAGLGVIKCFWRRQVIKKKIWETVPVEVFEQIPEDKVLDVKDNGDGTVAVKFESTKVIKDQPVIQNLMPGEWIYLPEKDMDGISVFEAHRHYMLPDDLKRLEKEGYYENVKDVDFSSYSTEIDINNSLDEIADAIANYTGERTAKNADTQDSGIAPNERQKVLVYEVCGKYDIDGDGLEEHCIIHVCGNTILRKEVNEYQRPIFFDCTAFNKSYVRWKEAIADMLQDIQDLKTALMRQIIINTAKNNNRQAAVDMRQKQAVSDLANGKKLVRMKLTGQQSIKDVLEYIPDHKLSPETFPLIEMLQGMSEQRSGTTRYNQGLDADSLNKTATGISKIMAASQQKLRMAARNLAETGLVPLYKFLVELNQRNLNQEMIVRLTGEYHKVHPDDIKGQFDIEIVSNIGLQDSQLTIQNLMVMFTQVLPPMVQMGVATPIGVYNTAKKLIEEMGFSNSSEFIGQDQEQLEQSINEQQLMNQLPQLLAGVMKQAGMQPEQAARVVQGVMAAFQGNQQEGQNAAK